MRLAAYDRMARQKTWLQTCKGICKEGRLPFENISERPMKSSAHILSIPATLILLLGTSAGLAYAQSSDPAQSRRVQGVQAAEEKHVILSDWFLT